MGDVLGGLNNKSMNINITGRSNVDLDPRLSTAVSINHG